MTAPARRKPGDSENDHGDNNHPKRAKTTHPSSSPTFQQDSLQPSELHRNKIATQFDPDAAKEPPVSRAGTDCGTAPTLAGTRNNDDLGPANNMRDTQWQSSPLGSATTQISGVCDASYDLYDVTDEEDVVFGNAARAPRGGTSDQ